MTAKWFAPTFVLLLTLGAALLRWQAATRSGLWGDESLFLFVAGLPSAEDTLHFLRFHESHPPLFYLLMRAWQMVAGYSDTAALVLPVVFSTALVPTAFVVGSNVFGKRAGIVAAMLIAVSAALIDFGVQVRPYALLQLVCLLSTWLLYVARWRQSKAIWGGYVLTAVLLPYLHNWGWVALIAQGLAYGLTLLPIGRHEKQPFLNALAAYSLILLLYLPWLPVLIGQSKFAGHAPLNLYVLAGKTLSKIGVSSLSLENAIALGRVLTIVVVVSTVAAAWWSGVRSRHGSDTTKNRRFGYVIFLGCPLIAVVLALVLSSRSDLMKMRCLTIVFAPLLVAGSGALGGLLGDMALPRRVQFGRIAGSAAALCTTIVLLISIRGVKQLVSAPKSSAREYATLVTQQVQPDDAIVIAPEWNAASFNWYFKGNNPQVAYPTEGKVEAMQYDNLLARYNSPENFQRFERLVEQTHAKGRRIWCVLPADFQPASNREIPSEEALQRSTDWYMSGLMRTQQVYRTLKTLYGAPKPIILSSHQPSAEISVFLFENNKN